MSRSGETRPRHADFTEAEVITVTACPVRHDFSGAARDVIGSTTDVTDKTDTEISPEDFLSKGDFDHESGHLSREVPVSPRLQRMLRCAVLYADWREDSQFCYRDDVTDHDWREDSKIYLRHDVTTNKKVRFSWFGQEDDDDDLDDVSDVRVYCAVLEGVWREEGELVENHVTSTTGGDDVMASYYPGHGRRNGIQSGNENLV
ncbi:Hypp7330 [Branchiostoma lanceolatum]|uniref:Hypp7330 protein n=1 Tax=Branchiostoma lanceolatum TaxID=7740 RepID=A0A8K0ECX4_BRALA|nr:Hypp7330 [Branchiostoma lanceolatum]